MSALVAAAAIAGSAHAAPQRPFAVDDLQRNGAVSRHLWAPGSAIVELAGSPVIAGIAIGLHDGLRTNLGAGIAPSLSMRVGERSTLSLLAGAHGAVMVVLQTRP